MSYAMPAFDTLKYAESLQAAGIPEAQAKAHARAAADAYDVQLQRLATKEDLRLMASELRGEMAGLRGEMAELRGEMTELRSELRGEMTELRSELRGGMTALRGEVRSDISDLRSDLKLVKWIGVTTAAAVLSQIAKGFL
jgi:chromosome segregation ATPase